MPKLPRLTAPEAEAILLQAGFLLLRTRGSHRIYTKGSQRIVLPFHAGRILHPKIIKQVLETASGEADLPEQ
ncbi:type II toxin-antitoxin system HicA family toxin [Candidatus Nitrospira inopinata]|uniref:YcfA family protein n=1 Tax=Candidatus Nitrospira inopinata TaxID=1715989 RepID=A0A0S4KRS5_9BACT|nr:type II toxin-antitoxin system HicA family toxin [Candidatus Nitrospira inopinata]CUQ66025.1 YcfA family protein [Candidatus Nitrospira inopinata]